VTARGGEVATTLGDFESTLDELEVVAIDSRRTKRVWAVALITEAHQGLGTGEYYAEALQRAVNHLRLRKNGGA
jgi:hypothetical protein